MTATYILPRGLARIAPRGSRADAPPLILVVDGNHDSRQLSTSALFHSGYEVDEADDCMEAWEGLKNDRYDLLFNEYAKPLSYGFTLMRELRSAK